MNNQKNKIAIIGGGIIGIYLSWKLAEKGEDVYLFEKRDKVGKEACSGLFSNRILDIIPESKELIENTINSVFINFPRKSIEVKFSKEFLIMDHFKLDNFVLDLAKQSGAKVLFNQETKEIPEGFDFVIGCDGYNSNVRKSLGLKDPNFSIGIQGIVKEEDNSNYVEVWPKNNGFIWKIPRKKDIEYGIFGPLKGSKGELDVFLSDNNIQLSNIKSAIIPFGLRVPKNDKITLCGDSMGLTKPWSGGGVVWGLISADMLLKDFSNIKRYNRKVKRFFSFKILLTKIITKIVFFFGFNFPWIFPKKVKMESDFII
jgi:digeranylgeranylglycerophospholipid reductase